MTQDSATDHRAIEKRLERLEVELRGEFLMDTHQGASFRIRFRVPSSNPQVSRMDSKPKILIVEDESINAVSVQRALQGRARTDASD